MRVWRLRTPDHSAMRKSGASPAAGIRALLLSAGGDMDRAEPVCMLVMEMAKAAAVCCCALDMCVRKPVAITLWR